MGDIEAGLNTNVFILIATAVITSVIIHFLYKTIFGSKKEEALEHETESNQSKLSTLMLINIVNNIKIT